MRPVESKNEKDSGFVKVGTGCQFTQVDMKRRWNICFFFAAGIELQYTTAINAAVRTEICVLVRLQVQRRN